MRSLAVIVLLVLATPAGAKKERPPNWECTVEKSEGDDHWSATDFDVEWYRLPYGRADISVTLLTYSAELKQALRQSGPFRPGLNSIFSVSPWLHQAKQPLWVEIAAGDRRIGPLPVGKSEGSYSSTIVPLADVKPMIDAEPDIVVTFYFASGEILDRETISPRVLGAAIDRLMPMFEQREAIAAHPEGQCVDHNKDILIID